MPPPHLLEVHLLPVDAFEKQMFLHLVSPARSGEREGEREREREREKERHRDTERQRDRETEPEPEAETETERRGRGREVFRDEFSHQTTRWQYSPPVYIRRRDSQTT